MPARKQKYSKERKEHLDMLIGMILGCSMVVLALLPGIIIITHFGILWGIIAVLLYPVFIILVPALIRKFKNN
jgi:hypothetical protein